MERKAPADTPADTPTPADLDMDSVQVVDLNPFEQFDKSLLEPLVLPEPELVQVAEFTGVNTAFQTSPKLGGLELKFHVDSEQKYAAIPVTDYQGQEIVVRVFRRVFPGFDYTLLDDNTSPDPDNTSPDLSDGGG